MSVIQTKGLSKLYKNGSHTAIKALDHVDLQVESGEIVALLGLNGAGKTTFIKLILGLTQSSMGSGMVFNRAFGTSEVRKRIGYLPELHNYPGFLNAATTLYLFGQMYGLVKKTLEHRVQELLDLVGLSNYRSLTISKYSKGMKQRLGLARALLLNPDLILLDEPTEGLDPIARKEIRELLLQLKAEGKTVFLNSHILSEVERICDRAIILKQGKIIQQGFLKDWVGNSKGFQIEYQGQFQLPPTSTISSIETMVKDNTTLIHLSTNDTTVLNQTIDALRHQSCTILSIEKIQTSLEEYFIHLVH